MHSVSWTELLGFQPPGAVLSSVWLTQVLFREFFEPLFVEGHISVAPKACVFELPEVLCLYFVRRNPQSCLRPAHLQTSVVSFFEQALTHVYGRTTPNMPGLVWTRVDSAVTSSWVEKQLWGTAIHRLAWLQSLSDGVLASEGRNTSDWRYSCPQLNDGGKSMGFIWIWILTLLLPLAGSVKRTDRTCSLIW